MTTCRYTGSDQPRMLRTHERHCDDAGCYGCEPCPERHCVQCGRTHVDRLTCPGCVGAVRDDLGDILEMVGRLPDEAEAKGIDSEAAMLWGPTADPETWQRRHRLIVNAAVEAEDGDPSHRTLLAWMEDCRDEQHPLWVLGTWDMLITEHYGHDRTSRVTIEGAASYLGRNLTDLANDEAFAFDELAREIRGCRGHLEDVLRDGERDEKGAPCPACRDNGAERAPALVKVHGDDEARDGWMCRRCKSRWTQAEYRMRVVGDYLAEADRLTAPDIERQYRVAAGTVRVWALRGKVRKRGRDESGRQLYDVADVVASRDGDTLQVV